MTLRISWLAAGEWVVLTLSGVLLAGGAHFPGAFGTARLSLAALDLGAALVGFVFGAVSGLMIAGLQGFVLKAWGRSPRAWIGLNAAGFAVVHALADGFDNRPLVVLAGGLILAVCQYLALRPVLSQAGWWLPLAAGAWWLGFGLSASSVDYNLIFVGLILGGGTGLGLRLLFLPAARPEPSGLAWSKLSRAQKVRLALISVAVVILAVVFAFMTGLIAL
jgi:hypothetical protein